MRQLLRQRLEGFTFFLASALMVLSRLVMMNGVFRPEELDFLSRVFAQSITPHDNRADRIDRALATIEFFRSGVTDEATLVGMVSERLFTTGVEQEVGSAR